MPILTKKKTDKKVNCKLLNKDQNEKKKFYYIKFLKLIFFDNNHLINVEISKIL